jgi:phosphoglycolate phosphatase
LTEDDKMRPTVLLFDIDGTLVLTGGAGRIAMVGAFVDLYGRSDVFDGTNFGGMTDRAIARVGIRAAGREPDETAIDRALDRYLELLADALTKSTKYRVLPGVEALLASLRDLPNVAIGLGTGNVRRGAYAKLTRGAIHGEFAFGGFGCDHEDRVELLRAGAKRGAEQLGAELTECRIVVIGDTPKDVAAARGLGAPCIGVGTGGSTPAELVALGAVRAFDSLEADGVRAALLDDGSANQK